MALRDDLSRDMKEAMKARDQVKLDTLRMVLSALKNKEIDKKGPLDEGEGMAILNTLVKQRREAADLFRKGGREDLAEKEEGEILLLKTYLPEALGEAEVAAIVDEAAREAGASSAADMGKVMKIVMARVAGRAEGRIVNELVKKRLSG